MPDYRQSLNMPKGLILVKDLHLITTKKRSLPVFGLPHLSSLWSNYSTRVHQESHSSLVDLLVPKRDINYQNIIEALQLYDQTKIQNSVHFIIQQNRINDWEKVLLRFKNEFPYRQMFLHIIGQTNLLSPNTNISGELSVATLQSLINKKTVYTDERDNEILQIKDYNFLPGDLLIIDTTFNSSLEKFLQNQQHYKYFFLNHNENSKLKNWLNLDLTNESELFGIAKSDYQLDSLSQLERELSSGNQSFVVNISRELINKVYDERITNHIINKANNHQIKLVGYGTQKAKRPIIDIHAPFSNHYLENLEEHQRESVRRNVLKFI